MQRIDKNFSLSNKLRKGKILYMKKVNDWPLTFYCKRNCAYFIIFPEGLTLELYSTIQLLTRYDRNHVIA